MICSKNALALVLMALAWCFAASALAQNAKVPSEQELREMYDAGQFHNCLQWISRLLALKGDSGRNYDRGRLLLLRGDCQVQIGDGGRALAAYQEAQEMPQPDTALAGRAGVLLIQNSRGLSYKPARSVAIDLKDPDEWKKAAADLFALKFDAAEQAIERAQTTQQLEPIMAVLPQLADLAALDRASGGDGKRLAGAITKIDQRTRDLMTRALAPLDARTSQIEAAANELIAVPRRRDRSRMTLDRRGLLSADSDALNQTIDTAGRIYRAALLGQEAARVLSGQQDAWQPIVDQSYVTLNHAQAVLDAG
jgi:hypothetical protein